MIRRWIFLILIIAFVVYAPFLKHSFVVIDDNMLIFENPNVLTFSAHTIARIFTSYDPELYIPLTLFVYQLLHVAFDLRPFFYHLVSLLLHLGSAYLLWGILRSVTKREVVALTAAALFALHPINVETVLWAAALKDALSSFLLFATISAFLRFEETDRSFWYACSVGLFTLALLAKVSVLIAPFVLLLLAWGRGIPLSKRMVKTLTPFFVLDIVFFVIAIIGKAEQISDNSAIENVLLTCKSAVFYIERIFLPTGFSILYSQAAPVTILSPEFFLPVAVVCAMLVSAVLLRQQQRAWSCGVAFYFLALMPSFENYHKSGFVFFGSDRYAYVAAVAVFVLIGYAFAYLLVRRWWRVPAMLILIMISAVLVVRTRTQAATWRDSLSLFTNAVAAYPLSAMARNNLAAQYMVRDREEDATKEFTEAIRLDPGYVLPYINLAHMAWKRGESAEQERLYRAAMQGIAGKPHLIIDDLEAHFELAQLLEDKGKSDEGLRLLERAVELLPTHYVTHLNLGIKYFGRHRLEDAARELETGARLRPRDADTQYYLAGVYSEQGKLEEARQALERVLSIDPGNAKASEHLGNIEKLLQ